MAVLLSERRSELGLFASLKTHLLARPRALLGVTACPDSLSVLTCSHQGVFNATSTQPLYLDCSSVCRTMASLSSRQLINFNFHWCFSMGGCPPAPSEASPPCAGFCSPLGLVAGKERGRPAPMVPFSSRSCPRACIHWGPWGGLRKAIRRPCCRKVVSGGLFLLAGSWRSPRRASSDGNYGVLLPACWLAAQGPGEVSAPRASSGQKPRGHHPTRELLRATWAQLDLAIIFGGLGCVCVLEIRSFPLDPCANLCSPRADTELGAATSPTQLMGEPRATRRAGDTSGAIPWCCCLLPKKDHEE